MKKKEIFRKGCLLFIVALAFIILSSTTVFGDTIRVPGDYSLIQTAIDAATDGDTVLVADGTYKGTGNKNLDFRGKAITIRSENGHENCIIDCEGDGKAFYIHSREASNSVVSGFTIINGDEGGIFCDHDSSPTITNCIIKSNFSGRYGNGGGIQCYNGASPTITNCTIIDNKAYYSGGGIYFKEDSAPTITNCIISGNTTEYRGGGGISGNELRYSSYYQKSPSITNCIITGNSAKQGGGLDFSTLSSDVYYLTISNCIIIENMATDLGGGIYFNLTTNPDPSQTSVSNCIISKNIANNYGGGIYLDSGYPDENYTLTNCTISDNSSTISGGGIFVEPNYQGTLPNLTITNSILWKDSPDELAPFGPDYVITYSDIQSGHEGKGNINADPRFLGNGDYHLTESSPCIDKGTSVGAPSYDIDGDQRPLGAGYDMGADEYPSTKTIPKAMPWIPLLLLDD